VSGREEGDVTIGEAARRLLTGRGLGSTVVLGDVISCWDDAVGPQVAAHAQPKAVRAGTLVVEVDDPVWATQLKLLEDGILNRLAASVGPAAVKAVHVRVARR
jgi:predicted nucleic acid-binding Zn ribbon protein